MLSSSSQPLFFFIIYSFNTLRNKSAELYLIFYWTPELFWVKYDRCPSAWAREVVLLVHTRNISIKNQRPQFQPWQCLLHMINYFYVHRCPLGKRQCALGFRSLYMDYFAHFILPSVFIQQNNHISYAFILDIFKNYYVLHCKLILFSTMLLKDFVLVSLNLFKNRKLK